MTDQDPQTDRNFPATFEWEQGEWTYPAGGPVIESWPEADVIPAPEPQRPAAPAKAPRSVTSAPSEPAPFVWKRKDTVTVLRFVVPAAVGGTAAYGAFMLLAFLVTQTLFWVGVGVVFVLTSFLSVIREGRTRDNPSFPPVQKTRGDVTTNVYVRGQTGNVTTNVYVQNDEV